MFYFVLMFLGFSRFLFCVLLCLLILSQGKTPPGKISPGKKSHRKNAFSTFYISVIPPSGGGPVHARVSIHAHP